jgi:hypothetical protein
MSFFSDPLGSIGGTLSSAGLGSIGNGLTNLSKSFGNQSFAEKALELAALGAGGYAAMGGGLADLIPSFGDTAIPGGAPVTDLSTAVSAPAGTTMAGAAQGAIPSAAAMGAGATGWGSMLTNPYVLAGAGFLGGALASKPKPFNAPNPQTTPIMQFTGAGGVHYPTRPSGYAGGGTIPANPNAPMVHNVNPQFITPTSTPVGHPVLGMAGGGSPFDSYAQYLQEIQAAKDAQLLPQNNQPNPATSGGTMPGYATGGVSNLGSYSDGGRMLKGPGDGMSDSIPATINNHQPARLANDEFVVPADVVSHLGNGSSDAGAKKLYSMMDRVRRARTGTPKQAKAIHPDRYIPS